jgi:hypothetical protein
MEIVESSMWERMAADDKAWYRVSAGWWWSQHTAFWETDLRVCVRELVKSGISVTRFNHLNIMQYSFGICKWLRKQRIWVDSIQGEKKIRNINKYISKTHKHKYIWNKIYDYKNCICTHSNITGKLWREGLESTHSLSTTLSSLSLLRCFALREKRFRSRLGKNRHSNLCGCEVKRKFPTPHTEMECGPCSPSSSFVYWMSRCR